MLMCKMLLELWFLVILAASGHAWSKEMETKGMFEGDIQVTPEQMQRLLNGTTKDTNEFGSIIGSRWTNGIVPYYIESSIGSSGRQQIQAAIDDYHKYTCLKFVPRTNQGYYISFYNGQGCHSPVGMQGRNRISLQYPGCQSKGTILHEIGHSIGLLHEQSRPDRDQYVTIHSQNLYNSRLIYNFQKSSNINSLGTPYDLHSMMHYSSTAFARSGTRTITTRDPSKQHIIDTYNRITGFSKIDIKQINLMYKCKNGGGGGGGSGGSDCTDSNTRCSTWSQQGFCSSGNYVAWMKKNCCKSCKTASSNCVNKNQHCQYWASLGYCKSGHEHYQYMKDNCCKACNL